MIRDLNAAGNVLQKAANLGNMHALPKSWDTMKVMMHNESIIIFAQLSHHLELEEEQQVFKLNHLFM